ncbi:MAG: septum formation family protein [Acidimicrobiia bacterium]
MSKNGRWVPVLGATLLVLAACSGGTATTESPFTLPPPTSEPETPATEPPVEETTPPTSPPTTIRTDVYLWQAGDCVNLGPDTSARLPHAPYGSRLVVACSEPHTHEVFFTSMREEPPEAPYPEQLADELWDICYREFSTQVGFLASTSTLEPVLYLPDEAEWAVGERYHACVVYQNLSDAEYLVREGSIFEDPDSFRWELPEGACLDSDASSIRTSPPIPCEDEHSFEHVGVAVHPAVDGEPFPGEVELLSFLEQTCNEQLVELASFTVDPLLVRAFTVPLLLPETDWDLGQRSLPCLGFAATIDGVLFNVRGSFADEGWEVLEPRGLDEGVTA